MSVRSRSEPERSLPRVLGTFSMAAVMVGMIIGSGIFRVPSSVAASVGAVWAVALIWVLGGVMALFGSLVMAELSCLFPVAGGEYVFIREAFGRFPAFLYGWTRFLLLTPTSFGALALILAAYLRPFLPFPGLGDEWIAMGVLFFVTTLNVRSLVWSAWLENTLALIKVLFLLGLGVLLFAMGRGAHGALGGAGAAEGPAWMPSSWTGFGLALVTVMWTYSGWSTTPALAGEVKDPGRTLPRALIGGILTVILVYLVLNGAFLYVLPVEEMAASSMVAADAAGSVLGSWGTRAVAAMAVVALFGSIQASMMLIPRFFFAMARDGLLPFPVAGVHARFLTPHGATILTGLLGMTYVMFRSFEQLAQGFILGTWPFYFLIVGSVFVFRRTRPYAESSYRTWGYPVVPVVFLLASAGMIVSALVEDPGLTFFSFGLIAAGAPVYLLVRNRRWFGLGMSESSHDLH